MKKLITLICFLLLVGFTAVCAAVMAKTQEQISQDETDGKLKCGKDSSDVQSSENSGEMQQTGYTVPVPSSYKRECDRPGHVTRVDYDSKDYVRDNAEIKKSQKQLTYILLTAMMKTMRREIQHSLSDARLGRTCRRIF